VVATPIGNLADISFRAVEVFKQVDLIAAEDTRHVRLLLQHYGISNKLLAFHQHNEHKVAPELVVKLRQGMSVALVSDAGTPLLSDPGLPLVKLARAAGLSVSPVPGASALIAALSVSGLPLNRFVFEGFLPRTASARQTFFKAKKEATATWVFYESSHRILACIKDLAAILPAERKLLLARELTKLHETLILTTVAKAVSEIEQNSYMQKGEYVVVVDGAAEVDAKTKISAEQQRTLKILLQECSVKTAAAMTAEITGGKKRALYQAALELIKD